MIRVKKDINYDEFLDAIKRCEGEVYLKSPDISLNLKSSLCRFFALNQVFSNPDIDFYKDLEITFENPADVLELKDYLENAK